MSYVMAFLDEQGNVRPPKTWEEVQEMYCTRRDSCEPCSYASGYSMTHGGRECNHPLHPKLGIIHNGMSHLVEDIIERINR